MQSLVTRSLSNTLRQLDTAFGKHAAAKALGLSLHGPVRVGQASVATTQPNAMTTLKPQAVPGAVPNNPIAGLAPAGRGGLKGQKMNPIERLGPLNGAIDGKPGSNVRHGS